MPNNKGGVFTVIGFLHHSIWSKQMMQDEILLRLQINLHLSVHKCLDLLNMLCK